MLQSNEQEKKSVCRHLSSSRFDSTRRCFFANAIDSTVIDPSVSFYQTNEDEDDAWGSINPHHVTLTRDICGSSIERERQRMKKQIIGKSPFKIYLNMIRVRKRREQSIFLLDERSLRQSIELLDEQTFLSFATTVQWIQCRQMRAIRSLWEGEFFKARMRHRSEIANEKHRESLFFTLRVAQRLGIVRLRMIFVFRLENEESLFFVDFVLSRNSLLDHDWSQLNGQTEGTTFLHRNKIDLVERNSSRWGTREVIETERRITLLTETVHCDDQTELFFEMFDEWKRSVIDPPEQKKKCEEEAYERILRRDNPLSGFR